MIWDERNECMSRENIREVQSRNLRSTVRRVYDNVPFYRRKLEELGIEPGDIRGIEDLSKLPFTTKEDLRENYPYGLLAVPMSEVVRLHASSGTTGRPVVVGYTRNDLWTWSEVVARCLAAYGVSSHDFIQVAYGYGLFTGGLGLHYGAEKVGASVIPISGGNTKKQIQIMVDFGSTVLACTPSYSLYLAETIQKMDIHRERLKLRVGIFGAEPWTENMRKEIEKNLNIKAMDIYGLSEIIGPGVSYDCEVQNGLHVNEDHFIPEIIDANTQEVLPYGCKGELVFTTVTKEALPLIRYRTKDLSVLHDQRCECGRTFVRMEKCLARSDDMLIIRGVNVFPSQIETALLEIEEASPHYKIIVDRVSNLDTLEVWAELDEVVSYRGIKNRENTEGKIKHNIESVLGIGIKLKLVEPGTIERSEGKAKRVEDRRVY